MSKKNTNTAQVEETPVEKAVETAVEENIQAEEKTDSVVKEEPVKEEAVVEAAPEVKEEVVAEPKNEEPVEEAPVEAKTEVEKATEEAAKSEELEDAPEADPLPEIDGKYYVNFGKNSEKKEAKTIDCIEKYGFNHIVTAEGVLLAGSFKTEPEAEACRKKLAGYGFKGTVYTFY